MRLDPRLSWDDIDMWMEYAGARRAHDHTINTASNNVSSTSGQGKEQIYQRPPD